MLPASQPRRGAGGPRVPSPTRRRGVREPSRHAATPANRVAGARACSVRRKRRKPENLRGATSWLPPGRLRLPLRESADTRTRANARARSKEAAPPALAPSLSGCVDGRSIARARSLARSVQRPGRRLLFVGVPVANLSTRAPKRRERER